MADDKSMLVDGLDETWRSTAELCEGLDHADWDRPTDCPGWTVRDQLSHIIGTEVMLLGGTSAPALAEQPGHVRNSIGEFNEAEVAARRDRTGTEVLAEFREVTDQRLRTLRSMSDEEWTKDAMTPVGPGTYADFMRIRLFDSWIHEQDIRRALGRPGHENGPAAEVSFDSLAAGMPFVVGKKAKAPDGTTVLFDLAGRSLAVAVEGGRAKAVAEPPSAPTVTFRSDWPTWVALAAGRRPAAEAIDDGRLTIEGDTDLGRRIADNLGFVI